MDNRPAGAQAVVLAAVLGALLVDPDPVFEDAGDEPFDVLDGELDSLEEDEDELVPDVSLLADDSGLLLPDLRDSERLSVR